MSASRIAAFTPVDTDTPTYTPTETGTPTITPTATPCPDLDGDGICDSIDPDIDGDGCPNVRELVTGFGAQNSGGNRDPFNPWDYFDAVKGPDDTGIVRINDIVAVVDQYFIDAGNPSYTTATDRSGPIGPYDWSLGPPDGVERIDDVVDEVNQYFHDCG